MKAFFFFLAKYTPFWATPMSLIGAQFAYILWIKDVRIYAYFFGFITFICSLSIILYFIVPKPQEAAEIQGSGQVISEILRRIFRTNTTHSKYFITILILHRNIGSVHSHLSYTLIPFIVPCLIRFVR